MHLGTPIITDEIKQEIILCNWMRIDRKDKFAFTDSCGTLLCYSHERNSIDFPAY